MYNQQPPFMLKVQTNDTELFEVAAKSQVLVMKPGILDTKTKYLIMLAVDAFAGSSGVKGIANAARAAGATNSEISEALRIAYYIAGNKVLSSASSAYSDE